MGAACTNTREPGVGHDMVNAVKFSDTIDDPDPQELVRRLNSKIEVTRVSSRQRNVEEVMGRRESAASMNIVQRKPTLTNRMSRLGSLALADFISGIKEGASTKGSLSRLNLDGRLAKFGMQMKEMEGDGNCQFRSFAYNLFGAQSHHPFTRKAAVAHMEKNRDFFSIFFETPSEFKAYMRDMKRNRTWGDELTLRAVVEAYGCEAHVITSEPANWYLVYEPECREEPDPSVAVCPNGLAPPRPGKQVFLSYISPIHYNSVVFCRSE